MRREIMAQEASYEHLRRVRDALQDDQNQQGQEFERQIANIVAEAKPADVPRLVRLYVASLLRPTAS